jgi:hypothetical protein
MSLGELHKKALQKNWAEEIELENENADSLTIKVFLEGVQSKQPVIVKWKRTTAKTKK